MYRTFALLGAVAFCPLLPSSLWADSWTDSYAVVVSEKTAADPEWGKVVAALREKHNAKVFVYAEHVEEALPALQELFPRYTCFVATPAEAGRRFVADVHQLTRRYDDDPYADTLWGILTGYDAAGALRIAETREPLTIRKVASGTEVALEKCVEGVWYCELTQGHMVRKEPGGEPTAGEAPPDTTAALVATLNDYRADLFVTSGHATERNWQIGFRYRNGYFRCGDGVVFGQDTTGEKFPVASDNPKVYMPIGNCLMGHIDGQDAMALAFMNSAGVTQMLGYTVPTWFGYGGWGVLDYFVEQPGRYTFTEAFFANQHALIHLLESGPPARMERGLRFDRDVVAFYGDPAWQARPAEGDKRWRQTLTREGDTYTFEVVPLAGEQSFDPVNTNGSQRGGRPIVEFFPHRIAAAEILEGESLQPVIADNFLLVPLPEECDPARTYRVVFRAESLAR